MDDSKQLGLLQPASSSTRPPVDLTIAGSELTIHFHSSIAELEEPWLEFERNAIGTPFQYHFWSRHWYATVGARQHVEPFIVAGYRGDELAILVPLCIRKTAFTKCLTWLGHDLNDYNVPLVAEDLFDAMTVDDVDALWRLIFQGAGDIDFAFLTKLPERVDNHANPFAALATGDYTVGSHSIRLADNFDDFYAGARGSKSRRRLKNKEAKLNKHGVVEYVQPTDPAGKMSVVLQTLSWKSQQLNVSGATNPFTKAEALDLFAEMANDAAEDSLRAFALKVDGEIVAASFGFMSRQSFVLYQTAYEDGRYVQFSPGTLLLLQMFRVAIDERKEVFDFSLGNESYKFDWADTHDGTKVSMPCFTIKGHLAVVVLTIYLQTKCWIKTSPKRFAAARRIHSVFVKLKDMGSIALRVLTGQCTNRTTSGLVRPVH